VAKPPRCPTSPIARFAWDLQPSIVDAEAERLMSDLGGEIRSA